MTTAMTPEEPEIAHDLVSYAEIARVVELLPTLVREKRRRDGLSLRAAADRIGVAADRIGVAASTVKRFEDGAGIAWETVPVLLRWVGDPRGLVQAESRDSLRS
ncbi:MAG: hypothetical protein ACR2KO_15855 [Geodermatophilaceae bacterium]